MIDGEALERIAQIAEVVAEKFAFIASRIGTSMESVAGTLREYAQRQQETRIKEKIEEWFLLEEDKPPCIVTAEALTEQRAAGNRKKRNHTRK
jgi:hypothetical protein